MLTMVGVGGTISWLMWAGEWGRPLAESLSLLQPVYITFSQQWPNDFYIWTMTALLTDGQKKLMYSFFLVKS